MLNRREVIRLPTQEETVQMVVRGVKKSLWKQAFADAVLRDKTLGTWINEAIEAKLKLSSWKPVGRPKKERVVSEDEERKQLEDFYENNPLDNLLKPKTVTKFPKRQP